MTDTNTEISIVAPDDWHIHLRDGDALPLTVAHVARSFRRAIIMPNLVPPVTNAEEAVAYKKRILTAKPANAIFEPLMVLYLTDKTSPEDIETAAAAGVVACKLYPAGATTNSDSGVTAIENIFDAIEAMQKVGMKLLIHGEVTDNHIDIFEREAVSFDLMKRLALFFSSLIGLFSAPLFAMTYTNAINDSSWEVYTSVLACRMEHSVPFYGDVVFRTRAGEASGFYLRADASRFKAGEAQVIARSPVWMAEHSEEQLAIVGMKQGTRPLWLGNSVTELMLSKLNEGKEIQIVRPTWYGGEEERAKLAMSTIGFRKAYDQYLSCLTGLIPRNFDQLKRTSLLFPGGEVEALPSSITRQLDYILTLVKHDRDIKQFYIDGHTDSIGDRIENLELSKVRAELVGDYLTRRGIPEDWVSVRWHGERYPVASNANAAGRAKNRRVTVRLEKVKETEVLSLASK